MMMIMAIRFFKLTRPAVKALEAGQSLSEHGIIAKRLANGDTAYSVNVMVDGQRIHRVIGRASEGVTRQQAEDAIEAFRTRAREGRLDLPKGRKVAPSFADAAETYLERLTLEGGKGVARKSQHLRARLIPYFQADRVNALTSSGILSFGRRRQEDGAQPGTINRELATLSHMLRCCARWGLITKDQAPDVPRLREGRGRMVVLTPDQCHALLDGAKADQDPDLWLFVLVCMQTSMRHGEARQLRWENYDAHRRRFFIPKAKAGEREQPIPHDLALVLDRVRDERGAVEGFIFAAGPGSTSGCRCTFRKAFRRAVVRAALDPDVITPHVLRHTAITRLVKAGVDLPTVQKVSGHKTLAMVLRYSHVDGAHIDKAVDHLRL